MDTAPRLKTYKTRADAAKAHGKIMGVHGKQGGWLHRADGTPMRIQGWDAYGRQLQRAGIIAVLNAKGERVSDSAPDGMNFALLELPADRKARSYAVQQSVPEGSAVTFTHRTYNRGLIEAGTRGKIRHYINAGFRGIEASVELEDGKILHGVSAGVLAAAEPVR